MKIKIADKFRAFTAKDKFDFWFNKFTDEEEKLLCLESLELAEITANEKGSKRCVFAEYILQSRLVKLQNKAAYSQIPAGIIYVMLAAFLGAYL